MTIEDHYNHYVEKLNTIYEAGESANIADWIFQSIAGINRLDRLSNKNSPLDRLHEKKLTNALEDLLQHKPVQYVLNEGWWYKMKLFVNEDVLIPRPETEELVKWIAITLSRVKNEKLTIVDIGTGSGCVAIALKKELPGAQVIAIDVSAEALLVARRNATVQNAVIELLQLDFLDENTWFKLASFDIIASNPPYIPEDEKAALEENVIRFEPHIALFVPAKDPFLFYKKIALFATTHLNKNGKIFVEVHEKHAGDVKKIFSENKFSAIIKKDIYGRDRMICAGH